MMKAVLDIENPVFKAYLFYSSILVFKMMFMSIFTSIKRHKYKAFSNEEDAKKSKVKLRTDEKVERVRRAHLNDLENIPLFFVTGCLYAFTNPPAFLAINLFRIYTAARIIHTFVFAVCPLPQPARGLSWMVGFATTGYMAAQIFISTIA